MTLLDSHSDEYLLSDIGFESILRHIFIPIGKELEVGKTFQQEFFIRPDDAVTDENETLDLEFKDKSHLWKNDYYDLDDQEPILLIKYKIVKITSYEVIAEISGGLITASSSPSMKPSLTIEGKAVWNRENPMVNNISYTFDYSEKRKKSWMIIKGDRKIWSY